MTRILTILLLCSLSASAFAPTSRAVLNVKAVIPFAVVAPPVYTTNTVHLTWPAGAPTCALQASTDLINWWNYDACLTEPPPNSVVEIVPCIGTAMFFRFEQTEYP